MEGVFWRAASDRRSCEDAQYAAVEMIQQRNIEISSNLPCMKRLCRTLLRTYVLLCVYYFSRCLFVFPPEVRFHSIQSYWNLARDHGRLALWR